MARKSRCRADYRAQKIVLIDQEYEQGDYVCVAYAPKAAQGSWGSE